MLFTHSIPPTLRRPGAPSGRPLAGAAIAALVSWLAAGTALEAQIEVKTLGGGPLTPGLVPYGNADGNTLEQAQFHTPVACAADTRGFLYVADRDNGKVRRLDVAGNRTKTYLAGLSQPVDVTVDATNNLYVLCQGSGSLQIYDPFGYPVSTQALFSQPTAMALDGKGGIYVAEQAGILKRTSFNGGPATVVLSGLNQPQGLAFLPNGSLAVSEAGLASVRLWSLATGAVIRQIGGAAGFQDGPVAAAQFDQPCHLACAPDGTLILADQGNHRVRFITAAGRVQTLYGLDPLDWGYDHQDAFLGWWDGSPEVAEAREPAGVAIDAGGVIYTTEIYYHIVRQVTGATFSSSNNGGGGGTNTLSVLSPAISPATGYFPMGQSILVTDFNTSLFFDRAVYYTTDGTVPTTNSSRVYLTNNAGTIPWRESQLDLTSLRVRTFLGAAASETVAGTLPLTNQIGVHRDLVAGVGATVVFPITVALNGLDPLRSLQFRVEISPETPAAPPFGTNFTPIALTNTPYFPVASPSTADAPAQFQWAGYDAGAARGLAISYLGADAHLEVDRFAVVALIAATVPLAAHEGDRYRIQILRPSGTTDGAEREVALTPLSPVALVVTNVAYRVGDTAPGAWYNAGDFGSGDSLDPLANSDVNNAFDAAFGNRVPLPFTDLFDAFDAFPVDSAVAAGGDGQIRFLDWQIILQRSLGLDGGEGQSPWRRWSSAGRRAPFVNGSASLPASSVALAADTPAWFRQAAVGAVPVSNAGPGTQVDVPIYVLARPGYRIAGMQFRVTIVNESGAPALTQVPEFVPRSGLPAPNSSQAAGLTDLLCAWSLIPSPAFNPPLQGSNLIGSLRLVIPNTASQGAVYTLHFSHADGSPDINTQYDLESYPGSVWVLNAAARPTETISDEWKTFFFGSYTNALAAATADPDGDGFANQEEYLAGLNPTGFDWRYQWTPEGLQFRWFGANGRSYVVERSFDLRGWSALGSPRLGEGKLLLYTDTDRQSPNRSRFYRVRVAP